LGDAMGEKEKADRAAGELKGRLDAVKKGAAGKAKMKTFLGRGATDLSAVGGGNYLDELLTLAGGENVLQGGENSYPTIDREKLTVLDPEVVILLLPGASEQVVNEAKRFWEQMGEVKAVKGKRVYIWTEDWVLLPGWRVGDLAKRMGEVLHPLTATAPVASAGPPSPQPSPGGRGGRSGGAW
jgi:iron complex transport system substrate-binding protein